MHGQGRSAANVATTATAITGTNLIKEFGQGAGAVRALDNVSFSVNTGEFFTLLGPSGCGKTTLLRLIAGFEMPTSGTLALSGRAIQDLPPNKRPVNTVFQNYALFPHLTVAENIGFGLKMQGRPRAEVESRVAQMLALVRLEPLADRRPEQMSGGQQQRVALARALAPAPEVLLLDEPLSALDLKLRKEMQAELKRLQRDTGITFIFVTHDQEEALTMSDRIAVMSAGRIQQTGTPREIYAHPVNRFVADFIGETNFIETRVQDGAALLPGGGTLPIGGAGGAATLAIRPEQVSLTQAPGMMPATAGEATYFGTDVHLHVTLADGSDFRLRLPATAGLPAPGSAVGLAFDPAAVQRLEA